jgi:hypothetical protein
MSLVPPTLLSQLLGNGILQRALQARGTGVDLKPVVKIFTPDAAATWLLSELDPDDQDTAFGLCDLGLGFPELGAVSLRELEALRGKMGLPVELDAHFRPTKTISSYAAEARIAGRIVA